VDDSYQRGTQIIGTIYILAQVYHARVSYVLRRMKEHFTGHLEYS